MFATVLWFLTFSVLVEAGAAEIYPNAPITIVCPYVAGGGADISLRILGNSLQKYLGQPIVVLNKPGASGTVAGLFISKEKPDGYTIGGLDSSGAIPELFTYFRPATYTSKDLTPICKFGVFPYALVVGAESPHNNLDEFIVYAKKNPGLNVANLGKGHPYDVFMIALNRKANVDFTTVPSKGAGECITLLLGKHVEAIMISAVAAKPHVEGKKFKLLAIEHHGRLDWAPNVPTFAQVGYDFRLPHHFSIFGPKNLSENVVKTINEAMKKSIADSEFQEKIKVVGVIVTYGGPSSLQEIIEEEKKVTGALFKELGYVK